MNNSGYEPTAIAGSIGVAPSTVSRELHRLGEGVAYCYVAADQQARDLQGGGQTIDQNILSFVESKLRSHGPTLLERGSRFPEL